MDGKVVRDALLAGLKDRIDAAGGPGITLATVLVGDDAPSRTYVGSKHKQAQSVGMKSVGVDMPATATQAEVESAVKKLVDDATVHGILVQIPLPAHLNEEAVLDLIPAVKDVDGLTTASLGRLVRGLDGHVGCTPLGVMRLLEYYGISTSGKRAVVVGRSTLVGYPLSILLARKARGATPSETRLIFQFFTRSLPPRTMLCSLPFSHVRTGMSSACAMDDDVKEIKTKRRDANNLFNIFHRIHDQPKSK
jgi:methylenetetrahydrofolate dehydrogenase (NADP+)/methenyltetrahydrofolate cyclohydrolase